MARICALSCRPFPTKSSTPQKYYRASALAQGFGNNGGVFHGAGFKPKLGVSTRADEALRPQFKKSRREYQSVGQLFSHVDVVNAAGKNKGYGLA